MAQLRRSVLYMPGANQRALEKARTLAADALILDLEDSVSPALKAVAREQVVKSVMEGGYGHRELTVRINALSGLWGAEDLKAIAALSISAIVLPKVESAAQIHSAVSLLDAEGSQLDIWAMIETPQGVLNAQEIAASSPRLKVLVMGTNDLAKELRVEQTLAREAFQTSLGLSLLAARAAGLDIIDGVYIHIKDEAGLQQSCEQGRCLGFDGKTLIHPAQLAVCNQIFSPDEAQCQQAQAIVDAWEQAKEQQQAVVVVNDRLVEELHVREAERTLALMQQIAQRS